MAEENALLNVIQATLLWQDTIQKNQQVTAQTVDQASALLMEIYDDANSSLDALMKTTSGGTTPTNYSPSNGRPGDVTNSSYSTEVQIWETNYNKTSQEWQSLENNWNTPIQALSTQEQTLGNDAQEASQVAATMIQPMQITANLLQSQL